MKTQSADTRVRLLAIIPMGIAINLAIGLTVSALKLPIFLDSIGTVLFTILCGWRVGATVGVLSFLVGGIANPLLPYFVFTQFTIAWVAGLSASRGGFKSVLRVILTGIIIGYAAALVIEQTTSGLRYADKYPCPVVSVASSVLKREVESIFIAECVIRALIAKKIQLRRYVNCGVVGFGPVGTALCRELKKRGVHKILVFDRNPDRRTAATNEGFQVLQSAKMFVEQSDLLFGRTGEDFGRLVELNAVRRGAGELLCVSCGSSDGEFASWISTKGKARLYRRHGRIAGNGFSSIVGRFATGSFRVLNGGFPINLDRSAKSDPVDDFVLTRMLVFVGILQALDLIGKGWSNKNKRIELHYDLERMVQNLWFKAYPHRLHVGVKSRTDDLLSQREP